MSASPSASRSSGPAPAPPGATLPAGVFTDLASAPVGAFVTVYGIDSAVSSWPVVTHGSGKTLVRVPDAAPALTVGGQSIPVRVHAGRVLTVSPGNDGALRSAIDGLRPGDTVYLRAGTYSGKYDSAGWNESNFVIYAQGTAAQPIAIAAYPGEAVSIRSTNDRPNFYLGGGRAAAYVTVAGFNLTAGSACLFAPAPTANVRVVGNTCTLTDNTSNTMTGMVAVQGGGSKILGNTFVNSLSRVIINNNHAVYVQRGADDVEVAYNVFRHLRMGHVIQVHEDGTPQVYTNVWIHDNVLEGAQPGDMRGVVVGNVDSASTVVIERNTFRNLGQGFSAISVYRGHVTIRNNTMYRIMAPGIVLHNYAATGIRDVTATGNRFETTNGKAGVAYSPLVAGADLLALSGNSYCGSARPMPQDASATVC